MYIDKLLLKLR